MKKIQILGASVLGLASMSASATTWIPDVNTSTGDFQEVTFLNFGLSDTIYDLVLFDAGSAPSLEPSATSLTLPLLKGIVEVSANPAPYTASFGADTAFLGATAEFELALWDGASFSYVSDIDPLIPGDAYNISFTTSAGTKITGEILGVDLAPVPVPAAVWLFGSGLLGLVGIARRRV